MGNGWTTSALLGMGSPWRWVGAALVLVTACARSAPVSGPSGPAADKPPLARTAPASQPPLEAPNEASVEQRFEHYLSAYRDLDYAGLKRELGLKQPKSSGLSFDPTKAKYFDLVKQGLKLTKAELETFRLRGMVSVDHVQPYSMGSAYYSIWARDLPVLITTDSILHALHRSYDEVIQALEVSLLAEQLDRMLKALHQELGRATKQSTAPGVQQSIEDVDLYVSVARNLLYGAGVPGDALGRKQPARAYGRMAGHEQALLEAAPSGLIVKSATGRDSTVEQVLQLIASRRLQVPPNLTEIYGGQRPVDYSQFKPRGHYTRSAALENYFRTMMWLGRADLGFALSPAVARSGLALDAERERRSAAILTHLLDKTGSLNTLQSITSITDFLVGRADNVSAAELQPWLAEAGLTTLAAFGDEQRVARALDRAATDLGSRQQIRSQVLQSRRDTTIVTPPPVVFQLFGQAFVLDSFALSKLVFDSILFKGEKQLRMMPSGLDVMAALGNDQAVEQLKPELEQHNYAANLLAMRRVVDDYPPEAWNETLYNSWLSALRTLDDVDQSPHFPDVMRQPAWQHKQLQTQLSSWAELRHDTILYAKQSYTAWPSCSYPDAYVEPYPAFYAEIARLAREAAGRLNGLNLDVSDEIRRSQFKNLQRSFVSFFDQFAETVLRLKRLAEKELRAEEFTPAEREFLENTIQEQSGGSGPPRYDGWYPTLIYGGTPRNYDPTIADVHTDPESGEVLEVGVGSAQFLVVAIDNEDDRAVYVGPAYSYYEFRHPASDRLDDEAWQKMIAEGKLPKRPDFTDSFVAPPKQRELGPAKRSFKKLEHQPKALSPAQELERLERQLQAASDEQERAVLERSIALLEDAECRRKNPLQQERLQEQLWALAHQASSCAPPGGELSRATIAVWYFPNGEVKPTVHLPGANEKSVTTCLERLYSRVAGHEFCGDPTPIMIGVDLKR